MKYTDYYEENKKKIKNAWDNAKSRHNAKNKTNGYIGFYYSSEYIKAKRLEEEYKFNIKFSNHNKCLVNFFLNLSNVMSEEKHNLILECVKDGCSIREFLFFQKICKNFSADEMVENLPGNKTAFKIVKRFKEYITPKCKKRMCVKYAKYILAGETL